MKKISIIVFAALTVEIFAASAVARPFMDPRSENNEAIDNQGATAPRDPACFSKTLTSTGGAAPRDPTTLSVRWFGKSNFELVYKNKIILLDAGYDRGSVYGPLGFLPEDVKKADVILIGHGHFDHMSEAASVGARTKATVVGAPTTTEKLATQEIPAGQVKTVTGKGGELLKFDNFTVEPILGRHGAPDKHVSEVMEQALKEVMPPSTPEQRASQKPIRERGTDDKRVLTEGTLAYLITLDNGFRIIYRDSAGRITDYERAAMEKVGRVDLALTAVSGDYINPLMVKQALEYMAVYKPDVVMPAHHDAPDQYGHVAQWRATEPLFQAMKDRNPSIVTMSRQYREPVCFNTDFNIQRKK